MGRGARRITVASCTVKSRVGPAAVTGRRGVTSTATRTVTRGVTNGGHKDRLAACRVAVVQSVALVNARTVRVAVRARVTRRAIRTIL